MKYTLRIKEDKTFRYIFRKGNFSKGKYIVVHSCETKNVGDNDPYNFFAVCVSKKNGNSVQRNRLKRLARETYKIEEPKIKRGFNIVIMFKKETIGKELDYFTIKDDIINCFEELDLYE